MSLEESKSVIFLLSVFADLCLIVNDPTFATGITLLIATIVFYALTTEI